MSKTLEKGSQKIQDICDLLKNETLEPAKQEAEAIIAHAKEQAEKIIQEAERQAKEMHTESHKKWEQEKQLQEFALNQASSQSLESLRQSIETHLFNHQLQDLIVNSAKDPQVISKLLQAMVNALDKEGLKADLVALIPKTASAQEVSALLGEEFLKQLSNKRLDIGTFAGGAQIYLKGKQMTLDMSDVSLKELLAHFLRKEFRKFIFGTSDRS